MTFRCSEINALVCHFFRIMFCFWDSGTLSFSFLRTYLFPLVPEVGLHYPGRLSRIRKSIATSLEEFSLGF